MRFLCSNCNQFFEEEVETTIETRLCPHCNSNAEEHIPEIFTSLDYDNDVRAIED